MESWTFRTSQTTADPPTRVTANKTDGFPAKAAKAAARLERPPTEPGSASLRGNRRQLNANGLPNPDRVGGPLKRREQRTRFTSSCLTLARHLRKRRKHRSAQGISSLRRPLAAPPRSSMCFVLGPHETSSHRSVPSNLQNAGTASSFRSHS